MSSATANTIDALVKDAFSKMACPLQGHSVYNLIEQAVQRAYELGKRDLLLTPASYPSLLSAES